MPEGDTVYKTAQYLAPRLEGATLVEVEIGGSPLSLAHHCPVVSVRSHGKHLFIELSHGRQEGHGARGTLRIHLGLYGAWHHYQLSAPWRKPRWQATLVLSTAQERFVCFNAAEVDWLKPQGVRSDPQVARLGPDLLAEVFDVEQVVERLRRHLLKVPERLLIDLLLDQSIAAGIGNVYKSELLFAHHLPPTALAQAVGLSRLKEIYIHARHWLQSNVGFWRRTTTSDRREWGDKQQLAPAGAQRSRLWVYGRQDAPCLVCKAPIAFACLGRHRRKTYWCTKCQPQNASAV